MSAIMQIRGHEPLLPMCAETATANVARKICIFFPSAVFWLVLLLNWQAARHHCVLIFF